MYIYPYIVLYVADMHVGKSIYKCVFYVYLCVHVSSPRVLPRVEPAHGPTHHAELGGAYLFTSIYL